MSALVAILAVTVVTRLPHLGSGELNWDEGLYWLSLESMRAGHQLFTQVYSSQPPAFLPLSYWPWRMLGGTIGAARGLMVAWEVLGIASGAVIGWRLAGPVAGLSAAAILAIDPLMTLQSVTFQPDGPATALALMAVAVAAIASTSGRPRTRSIAAGLAGGLVAVGLLTKLLDVAALPALLAVLVHRSDFRRLLLCTLLGGAIVAFGFLIPWIGDLSIVVHQVVGTYVGLPWLGLDPQTFVQWIVLAQQPLLLLAGFGVLVAVRSHPRLVSVGCAWLVGAVLVLVAAHEGFRHLTVGLSPGLALTGAAGISRFWGVLSARGRRGEWLAAATLAVAIAAGGSLLGNYLAALPTAPLASEIANARALDRLVPASGLVFGDDQFAQAMAERLPPDLLGDTARPSLRETRRTTALLEERASSGSGVCAILFGSIGQLQAMPGFQAWVVKAFPLRYQLDGDVLYRHRNCG